MEPLNSLAVANWFIDVSGRQGQEITAMKIQKLVYYAHAWSLALDNKPLVNERVEAWRWGPVFPDIYDAAKHFGSKPVTSRLSNFYDDPPVIDDSDYRISLLQKIWTLYGNYSAAQLSRMTHAPGEPWEKAWETDPGRRNMDIDEETIKTIFKKKLNT